MRPARSNNVPDSMQRLLILIAAAALGLACSSLAIADPASARQQLEQLRARGKYAVAEQLCRQRLADRELSEAERATLTIEYSRTLAEHARLLPLEQAADLWRQAVQIPAGFVAEHPGYPRLVLVRLQAALAQAAHGESQRVAVEGLNDPAALDEPRATLRAAIAALRQIERTVADDLRRRVRPAASDADFTQAELQSLQSHVRYELAQALREQALCYPPGSADRINSLTQAGEALSEVLLGDVRSALTWSAALEDVARLRLLGECPGAEKRLATLTKQGLPPALAGRVRAERIQLALARGRLDEALAEAGTQQPTSAEAEYARLEALVAAWQYDAKRQNDDRAAAWQKRAVDQVRAIGKQYGPYWMRRAEARLARAIAGAEGPKSAETLAFAAAGYYRAGQLDEAVAAFEQASDEAEAVNHIDDAFSWALAAAAIEKERGAYRKALERYRAAAFSTPKDPRAAEAHLLAVYCAGQLARAQHPPDLSEYEQLLHEHLEQWPDGETASQALGRLGRLAEHRGDWQTAVGMLGQVQPGDPQYEEAVAALGRSYEAWLDQLHESGESGAQLAQRALDQLERIIGTAEASPQPTPASRAAVLAAARIWLKEIPNGALPAERLVRGALEHDAEAPTEWKLEAHVLLVPALAAQGKGGQADESLEEVLAAGNDQVAALLDTLTAVRRRATGDAATRLAELELSTEAQVLENPGRFDGDTLRAVRRRHIETLAETGHRPEALEAAQALAREFPRDGQTHELMARLLMQGNTADRQAAVQKWAEVAKRSRPGTARWFRALRALARTQIDLGQATDARQTIDHVAARYPNFGTEDFRRQFEALLREIDRNR
mgnify:CR=1 FL=1